MRMMSTGAARCRIRILSAIRLGLSSLPGPTAVVMVGEPHALMVAWNHDGWPPLRRIAAVPRCSPAGSSVGSNPNSSMEVDIDALDGPARLMAFLDALAAWLK